MAGLPPGIGGPVPPGEIPPEMIQQLEALMMQLPPPQQQMLQEELAKLPPQQRVLFIQQVLAEFAQMQAAQQQGQPPPL